uniref:Activin_recp domain-containing protein n=1 Tax=Rhabditophanes sp. KR3021 TaxID=114890 RepID=A0AC35TK64_9BILA
MKFAAVIFSVCLIGSVSCKSAITSDMGDMEVLNTALSKFESLNGNELINENVQLQCYRELHGFRKSGVLYEDSSRETTTCSSNTPCVTLDFNSLGKRYLYRGCARELNSMLHKNFILKMENNCLVNPKLPNQSKPSDMKFCTCTDNLCNNGGTKITIYSSVIGLSIMFSYLYVFNSNL